MWTIDVCEVPTCEEGGGTTLYGHAVGEDRVPCGAGRLPVVPYTMACQKSRLLGKHRLYHP